MNTTSKKNTIQSEQTTQETSNSRSFFSEKPSETNGHHVTVTNQGKSSKVHVHNFSTKHLSQSQLQILNKGLSFSPTQTFNPKDIATSLKHHRTFTTSLRNIATSDKHNILSTPVDPDLDFLFRRMKFLKKSAKTPPEFQQITNLNPIENFIESTRITIDQELKKALARPTNRNQLNKDTKTLKSLRDPHITIKPADKNLGIVILNSSDYVDQSLIHLASETYIRVASFPEHSIKQSIINILISFKSHLTVHKCLYDYLLPQKGTSIPKFYGLPKIHKCDNRRLPPLRPIISHHNSLLSHTARFIDHVLQPLAQSYTDYLKNSTQLITELEYLSVSEDIILVTLDVVNLYPSIPQSECLTIIHEEMCKNPDLIIFDPNLITRLLHLNMTNNYFQFTEFIFLQTEGTAMGASFSPTIANIFMSSFLNNFLLTVNEHPLFMRRYIDDIVILWPKHQNLDYFLFKLGYEYKIPGLKSTSNIHFIQCQHSTNRYPPLFKKKPMQIIHT